MARNAHPEVTRRRILETAQRLFDEKGYAHTSIQDIVDALGDLSKGAIYHHFPNKEAILEALTQQDWDYSYGLLDQLRDRDELTGLEKIRNIVRQSVTDSRHLAINREASRFLEDPTTLAHNLEFWQTKVADVFQTLILEGIEDGSVTVEHPHEAAVLFSLLTNYWVADAPTAAEVEPRLRCVAAMLAAIGLPVFDEELIGLTADAFRTLNAHRYGTTEETAPAVT